MEEDLEKDLESNPETLVSNLGEDDSDTEKIKKKEIIKLVIWGTCFFFLFFLWLFPTEEIIRSQISSIAEENGIVLDLKDLRFPFWGTKQADSLLIQTNTITIRAEECSFDFSLWGILFLDNIDLKTELSGTKIDWKNYNLTVSNFGFTTKLKEISAGKPTGDFTITIAGGKIIGIPDLPMIGEVKELKVKRGNFLGRLIGGKRLQIEKGFLDTNLMKLYVAGVINLTEPINYSQMDLKICGTLQESFAKERPDIAGTFAILPKEKDKVCVPVKGTIQDPKVEFNLQGASLPTSNPVENPQPQAPKP